MTKQQEIRRYLATVESATLKDIYDNTSLNYYAHWKENLSRLMSKMVKNGNAIRINPGVFKVGPGRQKEINREFYQKTKHLFD